uniref:Grh/CP2 DB domain-containing protein n=1 Tax=Bos indicus x Bos taurus TaxID=30522 RepID=A0A4W2HBR6_BOBOX
MADVCKYCSVGDLHLEGCLLEARAAEWGPLRPWLLQGYLLQQTVGSLEGESGRKSQSLLEEGVDRAEASRAFLFQEELANIPRAEQPCPVFQYVLCAATSLAQVNQGALGLGMERGERGLVPKCHGTLLCPQSVVRVVFHDRRLQYTEQQQLDGWRWSWPGDRILDINIPLSVGVLEPQVLPSQLNTVEFYWDPTKRTSLFLHVHCISTKFTRKKVGEKSVPFCLQIDTFKPSDKELPLEHLHSAGCLLKVFKPKGADRKLKTDREKIEKQPVHERNKYQTACESTIFMEVRVLGSGGRGGENILIVHVRKLRPQVLRLLHDHQHPHIHTSESPPFALTSPHSCKLLSPEREKPSTQETNSGSYPLPPLVSGLSSPNLALSDFSGTDLLKLTPQDLIQICGAADGIRLFNTLRARCWALPTRLTLYVAQETSVTLPSGQWHPPLTLAPVLPTPPGFYQEISLDELSAIELLGKLAELLALPANQVHRLFHQGPGGILILLSDQVNPFFFKLLSVQNLDGYYLVLT